MGEAVDPGGVELEVQRPAPGLAAPRDEQFLQWAEAALGGRPGRFNLLVRVVGEEESRRLNREYREMDYATNVLSFPAELPDEVLRRVELDTGSRPLGDLVICAPVVEREAAEQGKPPEHHWAHLVVHGILHLLGHDHEDPGQAAAMERLEQKILGELDIPDPYEPR
jgi:probable rRNA maturation factor